MATMYLLLGPLSFLYATDGKMHEPQNKHTSKVSKLKQFTCSVVKQCPEIRQSSGSRNAAEWFAFFIIIGSVESC